MLPNLSEHAFLPENDNTVKHLAVMSTWLPDCFTEDLFLLLLWNLEGNLEYLRIAVSYKWRMKHCAVRRKVS